MYCSKHFPFVFGNPKEVLLQTVKTQMKIKCIIMLHFIRVYAVLEVKRSPDKTILLFKLYINRHPRYAQWTIESLLYETRRKNPLVYKGLYT